MARVSVIVAARDAAGTLEATLASVAAQSYRDWELVLVDDGSRDGTAAVAERFGRATVIRHERAQGPAAARNAAVARATGELLAVLDADDLLHPGYLERQVACFDEPGHARLGIAGCDAGFCDAEGRPLPGRWSDRVTLPARVGVTELLRENPLQSKVVVARAAFDAAGGFAPDLRRAEDFDLWLRIAERGYGIVVTPDPLVTLRLRGDSLSAQSELLAAATAEVYDRALRRGRLDGPQRRLARRQRRLQRLVAARARAAGGGASPSARVRVHALSALVALEHPERWRHWLRRGVRAAGPGRHA